MLDPPYDEAALIYSRDVERDTNRDTNRDTTRKQRNHLRTAHSSTALKL